MTADPARGEIPLSSAINGALTFETYDTPPTIDGVWKRDVKKHRGENGWFAELYRISAGRYEPPESNGAGIELRQVSASFAEPDRINAFHIHPRRRQNEIWTVIQGALLIWLVDCRAESRTAGMRQRVLLSGEEPAQLHIPAGVAHGYRASSQGAVLIYAMSEQFDHDDPDEGRLPWDHFGPDLWDKDRG